MLSPFRLSIHQYGCVHIAEKNSFRCTNLQKWKFSFLSERSGLKNPQRISIVQILGDKQLQLPNLFPKDIVVKHDLSEQTIQFER